MKQFYVYVLTNKVNCKQYVGFTHNVQRRFKEHLKSKQLIGKALRKHKKENFTIDVLSEVFETSKLAGDKEIDLISILNSKTPNGYNQTDGGEGFYGIVRSKKWKKDQSKRKRDFWKNQSKEEREVTCSKIRKNTLKQIKENKHPLTGENGRIVRRKKLSTMSKEERSKMMSNVNKKRYSDPQQRELRSRQTYRQWAQYRVKNQLPPKPNDELYLSDEYLIIGEKI